MNKSKRMNKKGETDSGLLIAALVAIVAVVGLVILFMSQSVGAASRSEFAFIAYKPLTPPPDVPPDAPPPEWTPTGAASRSEFAFIAYKPLTPPTWAPPNK